jgi:hypothetical protein
MAAMSRMASILIPKHSRRQPWPYVTYQHRLSTEASITKRRTRFGFPFLSVWGDHSKGAVGFNGDTRRNGFVVTVNALKERSRLLLPTHGIAGNSHMMMLDKNNLKIADLLIAWVAQRAAQK